MVDLIVFISTLLIWYMAACIPLVIHEFGHYSAARHCLWPVSHVVIGSGPHLFSIRLPAHAPWHVRLFPIRAAVFVPMAAIRSGTIWQQVRYFSAGSLYNIGSSLLLFSASIALTSKGTESIAADMLRSIFTDNYLRIMMASFGDQYFPKFLWLAGLISFCIGAINLLPVGPLDGMQVVLSLIERLRKRALSQRARISLQIASLVAAGIIGFFFV